MRKKSHRQSKNQEKIQMNQNEVMVKNQLLLKSHQYEVNQETVIILFIKN